MQSIENDAICLEKGAFWSKKMHSWRKIKLRKPFNQSLRHYLPLAMTRIYFPSTIDRVFMDKSAYVKPHVRAPYTIWTPQPVIILSGRSHMKSYKKRRFSESISDSDKSQNVKITSELFYDIASLINIHFWAFLSLIL